MIFTSPQADLGGSCEWERERGEKSKGYVYFKVKILWPDVKMKHICESFYIICALNKIRFNNLGIFFVKENHKEVLKGSKEPGKYCDLIPFYILVKAKS